VQLKGILRRKTFFRTFRPRQRQAISIPKLHRSKHPVNETEAARTVESLVDFTRMHCNNLIATPARRVDVSFVDELRYVVGRQHEAVLKVDPALLTGHGKAALQDKSSES